MTLIKFEAEISDCRDCPFHTCKTSTGGYSHGETYHTSFCKKLNCEIKSHDYEKAYSEDGVIFEIPENCPFK